jgi:hypothetical protein
MFVVAGSYHGWVVPTHCFLIAQHVSSDTPLIIRSSKTVTAASRFTYVCGGRQLSRLSGSHSLFLNYPTCFERHTAYHQELKNCNCSLWFYIRLWWPAAVIAEWFKLIVSCSTCFERHTAHHQELKNCNCSLWFYIRLWWLAAVMAELKPLSHESCRLSQTYVKPEATITVFSSWWWAICRSKHVEQLRNIGIKNSTTRSILVGFFYTI